MKAVIFTGADINNYSFCYEYLNNADIIICCDRGMIHAKKMNIVPNYILGDFDSVPEEIFEFYKNKNIEIKTFPTKKDFTDTELGLNFAIECGANDIIIIGGIGSRLDHTLGNIQILEKALALNIRARLVNENNCVELINSHIYIEGKKGDLISLLPLNYSVNGIYTKGLEYPLKGESLKVGTARGISNVMEYDKAEITVEEGILIVIKSKD